MGSSAIRKITKGFQDMVQGRRSVTIGDVAEWLDKAPSTIYGMLNPYPQEGRHDKLGIEEAFVIADRMNDYTPIIEAMKERGFALITKEKDCPPLCEATIYAGLAEIMTQTGRLAKTIKEAMEDSRLSVDELRVIISEAMNIENELRDIIAGAHKAVGER